MMQQYEAENHSDDNGNPAGGHVQGLPWEDRSQPDDRLIVESVRELPPRRTERMS